MSREDSALRRSMFKGDRDYSVDIIRCISCMMVIATHMFWFLEPDQGYTAMAEGSTAHYLTLLCRSTFTAGTIIFVMISGIFFLAPERQVTARKIWGKNVLKMGCAYVLWMIIYAWNDLLLSSEEPFTFTDVIYQAVHMDQRHLWYIPMIIGVYATVPLLRVFTAHAKPFHYKYLFMALVFASLLNVLFLWNQLFPYKGSEEVNIILERTPMDLFSQYVILCVIGYWLYTYKMRRKFRILLYFLGLLGILSLFLISIHRYELQGNFESIEITRKFLAGNFLKCSALFLFLSTVLESIRLRRIWQIVLTKMSNATLFIYLFHWIFIQRLLESGWLLSGFWADHLILVGFIYVFTTYFAGFLISVIFLQSIPWIKMRNKILDAFAPNRRFYVTKK